MRAGFPLPDVEWPALRDYWDGAAAGELRLPRCDSCNRLRWYPEERCRRCGGGPMTWEAVSGRASLFSWVVVTQPLLPQYRDKVPFVPALVALEEDPEVRLATEIVDVEPDRLDFDLPLVVTFRPMTFPDVDGSVVAAYFTTP